MHMTRGWTGLRAAVIALAALAWIAPHAQADGILQYTTSGGPGNADVTGAPVISFVPVQGGSVNTASNISLGTFVVAALPSGQSTTYDNTPFTLSLIPNSFDGSQVADTPIEIKGFLNGTVSGSNQSSVLVTFDPMTTSRVLDRQWDGEPGPVEEPGVAGPQLGEQGPDDLAGPGHHRLDRPGGWRARAQHHRAVPQHGGRPRPATLRAEPSSAGRGLTPIRATRRPRPQRPRRPHAGGFRAPTLDPHGPRTARATASRRDRRGRFRVPRSSPGSW